MTKLKILRCKRCPGSSTWAQGNLQGPYKKEAQGRSQKEFEGPELLALKIEEGAKSQGM